MNSFTVALGMTAFWMFSPEIMVLIGNSSGLGTGGVVGTLIGLSMIVFFTSFLIDTDDDMRLSSMNQLNFGPINSVWLLGISGIFGTTIFGSTGMLVTAGFTFNEVFYYRFPNFGFAFLLLFIVLAINLVSSRLQRLFLSLAACCCAAGLLFLIGYGLIALSSAQVQPVTPSVSEKGTLVGLVSILLVFVGIDQISAAMKKNPIRFSLSFFIPVILLIGWVFVSNQYVEPERLLISTVPHMIVAGKIGDFPGRAVMGIVVIMGSLGAVYRLLEISADFVVRPSCSVQRNYYLKIGVVIFLAVLIGAMMGGGVAGSENLEVYIESSLLLWLIYSAIKVVSGSLKVKRTRPFTALVGVAGGSIILLGSVILFFLQDDKRIAACFVFSVMAACFLIHLLFKRWSDHHGQDTNHMITRTEV